MTHRDTGAATLADALRRVVHLHATAQDARVRRVALPHPFSNMSRDDWRNSISLWRTHGLALLDAQPSRPCPACKEASATPLFTSYDGYVYVECDECATWYVPKIVDHELFETFFAICPEARAYGDYTLSQLDDSDAHRADAARFQTYYSDLRTLLGPAARTTIDIGCGVGNSFLAAQEAGFAARGVEVNASALEVAARLGRQVESDTRNFSSASFDCVTYWESLEHMADVDATLQEAARLLKPNGVLAITVPNLNSPVLRGMRGDSMQIHGGPAWPGHINLFTLATLSRALERAGFDLVDACGQYSMNPYEFVGYQLGLWRGVRDYIAKGEPSFVLSESICTLIDEISPALADWETHCAMGPILRVFAQPKASQRAVSSSRRGQLDEYARALLARPARRGQPVVIADVTEFCATTARVDGDRLEIIGIPDGALTYAWVSKPLALTTGAAVSLRGKLRDGGFSFGLLRAGAWSNLIHKKRDGLLELELSIKEDGQYQLVIAHNLEPGGALDLSVDRLEISPPISMVDAPDMD